MYCVHCGEVLPETARFCRRCGTAIDEQPSSAPPAATVYGIPADRPAEAGLPPAPVKFVTQNGLSVTVCCFLLLAGFVAVFSLVAAAERISLVNEGLDGIWITQQEAEEADEFVATAAGFQIIITVVTAVLFITWTYRATANLERIGVPLHLTNGWVVGGWFIPVANLWFPFRVMWQAWHGSAPDEKRRQHWRAERVPMLVVAWWGVWIVSGVLATFGSFGNAADASLEDIRTFDIFIIISQVLLILAAILAALMVYQVTARQRAIAMARAAATQP